MEILLDFTRDENGQYQGGYKIVRTEDRIYLIWCPEKKGGRPYALVMDEWDWGHIQELVIGIIDQEEGREKEAWIEVLDEWKNIMRTSKKIYGAQVRKFI